MNRVHVTPVVTIKRQIKHSSLITRVLAGLSFATTYVLLKAEKLLQRVTDWWIKKTKALFYLDPIFRPRFFRMAARLMWPSRIEAWWLKTIDEEHEPLQASLASALFLRHSYSDNIELPEWKLDHKVEGLRFARALGLQTPELYQANVTIKDVIPRKNSVIKPVDNAAMRGVFIVYAENNILELKTGKTISLWEQLVAHIHLLLKEKKLQSDNWLVEEYIADSNNDPSLDIKFYTFYGQVGWITEILRLPEIKYHVMDAGGNTISSKYTAKERFTGGGVSKEEIALAEKVSLEIPAPFIRMDFLRSSSGLCFGEFTPRPGIVGGLSRKRDHLYGTFFHQAEARLYKDLLKGKRFNKYHKVFSPEFP